MNILPPVLSAFFTKQSSKNIDRNSGMLYNRNIEDSFILKNSVCDSNKLNLSFGKKGGNLEKDFFKDLVDICRKAIKPDSDPVKCLGEICILFKKTPDDEITKSLKTDVEKNFYNEIVGYYQDIPYNLPFEKYRKDIAFCLDYLDKNS